MLSVALNFCGHHLQRYMNEKSSEPIGLSYSNQKSQLAMTVRQVNQHAKYYDPKTEEAKGNPAITNYSINKSV